MSVHNNVEFFFEKSFDVRHCVKPMLTNNDFGLTDSQIAMVFVSFCAGRQALDSQRIFVEVKTLLAFISPDNGMLSINRKLSTNRKLPIPSFQTTTPSSSLTGASFLSVRKRRAFLSFCFSSLFF